MTRKFFTALIFTLAFMTCAYGAESETGDKVLARVGSSDITEREVLEFIQPFGQQALMMYSNEQVSTRHLNSLQRSRMQRGPCLHSQR